MNSATAVVTQMEDRPEENRSSAAFLLATPDAAPREPAPPTHGELAGWVLRRHDRLRVELTTTKLDIRDALRALRAGMPASPEGSIRGLAASRRDTGDAESARWRAFLDELPRRTERGEK